MYIQCIYVYVYMCAVSTLDFKNREYYLLDFLDLLVKSKKTSLKSTTYAFDSQYHLRICPFCPWLIFSHFQTSSFWIFRICTSLAL